MPIDHLINGGRAEKSYRGPERQVECENNDRTCTPHQQVAHRDDAGLGGGGTSKQWRDERRAKIDAEDHDDAELRLYEVSGGKSDQQQYCRDTRVKQPSHQRRDQKCCYRIGIQVTDDDWQELSLTQWLR